ncbi:hypothetical protein [Estrella lausannensis]|uniref:Uncharacterized protein n=1 Tax=Estrella lausannensis TaxID=483423 RepID=A0A0H5DS91_9BACT|nr:hypothetical protein [Estrella lausannensis]CRX39562.1 hypothetical protein ELAC_2242 [Estrella lausannensis]
MQYLTSLVSALQGNDLEPITKELNQLVRRFEYLSTLEPGDNLQPTTWGRAWLTRPISGMEECPIQKTFSLGVGLYSAATGAYSQENFDKVVEFYTGEIHKAKTLFEDSITVIAHFGEIQCDNEAKLRLLKAGKSAFWHVAVACQGLHIWAETLSQAFVSDHEARDYRVKAINGLFLQQNVAICKIFKKCLQLFPQAIDALADKVEPQVETTPLLIEAVADDNSSNFEREALFATRAAGECVIVTRNFIKNLMRYQPELLSHEHSERYEEKLQIKAYRSLMEKGEFVLGALEALPEEIDFGNANIDAVIHTIDTLHALFVKGEGGAVAVEFIAELIKATVDIDLEKRGKILDLLRSDECRYFPQSTTTLWQILAMQMVTSRFVMPLGELMKHAKKHPLLVGTTAKIKQLCDLFLVAADLTNKSHS